jgi:uncharacterized membrane protein
MAERYWEVDLARGIAVVAMIVFHVLVDLWYFDVSGVDPYDGLIGSLAPFIGATFLVLVGICLTISHSRSSSLMDGGTLRMKYVRRGVWTFGLGAVITLVSYILLDKGYILFGVLHCIGASILIAYPLLRFRTPNLIFGVAIISIGLAIEQVRVSTPYLLWLGLRPEGFTTLDYFPLAPWFGAVLVGIFLGQMLYPSGKRRIELKEADSLPIRTMEYMGRHALVIYFLHQPIVLGALFVTGVI